MGHKKLCCWTFVERKKRTIRENYFVLGCRVCVTGKAVNQGDEKGMTIPCILIFKGQSVFADIFSQELKKHM